MSALFSAAGAVVINEFVAASSERRLTRNAEGVGRVGTGLSWNDPDFDAANWSVGRLPAGYGFSGLLTDLTWLMKDKTPSLYLRKEFEVSPDQAALTNDLILSVQYNDGFVAYLNGREVARHNCGPTNHFVFANEPAANVSTNPGVADIPLGRADGWLVPGRNVLALQAHNAEQPSTTNDPTLITKHLPTPEFRVNAGLRISPADTNSPPAELIPFGSNAGFWNYFVGRAEPSGGLVDMGLLTRTFVPPAGEEDDYDTPSEFSDWVELYNNGSDPANLAGWSLTDDEGNLAKWRFPANTIIPAHAFLVVLCDNRDEANTNSSATWLHASFRLNDEGGYLGLFDQAGSRVDEVPGRYPPQVAYCSYGRSPADPAQFVFLATASPGTNNFGAVFRSRAGDVYFTDTFGTNLPGGLYTNSTLRLCLRPEVAGQSIRYTLDGSEPTETRGFNYTSPLLLWQPYDKTGVVVRARACVPGLVSSKIRTHTYLLRQPSGLTKNPVICLTAEPGSAFYKPDGLLCISGGKYPASGNVIWLADGPQSYNWALGDGSPFEREVHLEYYFPPGLYPTNQEPLRTDIGLRLSASSYSRPRLKLTNPENTSPWANSTPQKPSFNFFFNGEFGPGLLDYNLFTNYTTREFEHLRLRAGKNDISNPFIVDELVRRLYQDMGQAGARGLFCSLYLNGIYRGAFNLCERFREQFFQAHYRSELNWDVNYINTWVDGDSAAYNQLLTTLDRDLRYLSNWQAVTNLIDVDNAADYYLLNIYCAMWDWPGNNFVIARERSTGPLSRFRFSVWDAEGAFGVVSSASGRISYNTLTNDLVVPSNSSKYNLALTRIFRRLAVSPEFRLLFADHVNTHMFNGGALDDRDPDGTGPGLHHLAARLDELVREAGDLVRYSSGQAMKQSGFNAWWASPNGRRDYLLGTAAGRQQFRDAGFWPLTEPPVFSQHGGMVAPGFSLSMTSYVATAGQNANIYFTTNGADPRWPGGALNAAATQYVEPVLIPGVLTVKARARNTTTLEWSPMTTATFAPEAVPASAANLVIAELMYHPPNATATELAAGYHNADDFEFARLQNIGATPIDLAGVRFTLGITFDFTTSPLRYLNPGGRILVVANLAAFQVRYGHGCDPLIAGVYAGNLSNAGERLRLVDANNVTIRDFAYEDAYPWPEAADGDGPSLVLLEPGSNPDHGVAAAWGTAALPGGMPSGKPEPQSYSAWRALMWDPITATNASVSGPAADPDGDRLCNALEYALGGDPFRSSTNHFMDAFAEEFEGEPHLTLVIRLSAAAQDAVVSWEQSNDLLQWTSAESSLVMSASELSPAGFSTQRFRELAALDSEARRFYRLRLTVRQVP